MIFIGIIGQALSALPGATPHALRNLFRECGTWGEKANRFQEIPSHLSSGPECPAALPIHGPWESSGSVLMAPDLAAGYVSLEVSVIERTDKLKVSQAL
jgi:hypothetical protein